MKSKLAYIDARSTDGEDPALTQHVYDVVDDDGFQSQIRVQSSKVDHNAEVKAATAQKVVANPAVDLGPLDLKAAADANAANVTP